MKILLDTNVVLDLLLARDPFHQDALNLFGKIENRELTGFLCATTITTIDYLVSKHLNTAKARQSVTLLLELFEVAPVTKTVLQSALQIPYSDYEDAVLCQSARLAEADAIVTRNEKDFKNALIAVYSPAAFLLLKNK